MGDVQRGPWDYIIVGGGSAGCVLAARLSDNPACRVLLLDAGRDLRSPWLRIPGAVKFLIGNRRYDWQPVSEPDDSCRGRPIRWSAGRMLGGGSAINGMAWNRGLARDFDRWAQAGCSGWSATELMPYFKRIEQFPESPASREAGLRGTDGPQPVEFNQFNFAGLRPYLAACETRGIALVTDINAFPDAGVGATQCSTRNGLRHSSRDAFLRPAIHRSNLLVLTEAAVETLRFASGQCIGVTYRRGGLVRHAESRGEIVLTAGAFGSPALLLRSGVGPAAALHELQIPLVMDLPGVGGNLQDHAGVPISCRVTLAALTRDDSRGWRFAVHGARWLASRSGPAAGGAVLANGYFRSSADQATPDLHLQMLAFGFEGSSRNGIGLAPEPAITTVVNVCHPQARGELTLVSRDARVPPRCRLGLLDSPEDLRRLVQGLRQVRDIHGAASLAEFGATEISPGRACNSDADLEAYCRDAAGTQYHPAGTCAMGVTGTSVVDPQLRVRGLSGLRVADASVMPCLPSSNTNAPVMMIAEKAADLLRA